MKLYRIFIECEICFDIFDRIVLFGMKQHPIADKLRFVNVRLLLGTERRRRLWSAILLEQDQVELL